MHSSQTKKARVKILEVNLDRNLSFDHYIKKVCETISKNYT